MGGFQDGHSRLEWSVLLEVTILVFSGPIALLAVLVLPALPGVAGG